MFKKDGYIFKISTNKDKKYDVYKNDEFITSFGARGMEQYIDKIGAYSKYDHNDKKRRQAFKSRFKTLIDKKDKTSGLYFSNKYLW